MPEKHSPLRGTKCGRRERESRHEGRRERSLRRTTIPSCVETVKGILACWKAALFAERSWNVGLGRFEECAAGFLPRRAPRRRQRMSGGCQGGE